MKTAFFLTLISIAGLGISARAQVAFTPLGYLDGFGPTSEAYAVSADGQKVVGYSTSSLTSNQAVWWTTEGIAALPGEQNWLNNSAYGISSDASVIVGFNSWGGTEEAFYWSATTKTRYLSFPPPPAPATHTRASAAWDVSADGTVVVGGVIYAIGDGINATRYPRSFRWKVGDPAATLLPQLPGDFRSDAALGASQDGSLVVGYAFTSLTTQAAVYWSAGAGPHLLSKATDTVQAVSANAVTPDGTVIVGSGLDTATGRGVAFKWTAAAGSVALPPPTTGTHAYTGLTCFSVSGDGRVIVGYGENVLGREEAVFWIDEQPFRVSDVAFAAGVLPPSWEPFRAYGTDFTGNVICGHGQATSGKIEGYVLTLDTTPDPPPDPPAVTLPQVRFDAVASNGDFTIRYQTRPDLRYRVWGGTLLSALTPLNAWVHGTGAEEAYTITPATTGGAKAFFVSVEVQGN